MYRKPVYSKTTLKVNVSYEGERLEDKVNRIVNSKAPITDGAPIIYTNRKDGVLPEMNIRTDRWELAAEAYTHIEKAHIAKREAFHKKLKEENDKINNPQKPTEGKNESGA